MNTNAKIVLIDDVRDCARRARELHLPEHALALNALADELQRALRSADSDRPSLPPVLVSNQETRATATRHFQIAREMLRNIR